MRERGRECRKRKRGGEHARRDDARRFEQGEGGDRHREVTGPYDAHHVVNIIFFLLAWTNEEPKKRA